MEDVWRVSGRYRVFEEERVSIQPRYVRVAREVLKMIMINMEE